jgi:flagellar protein FliS
VADDKHTAYLKTQVMTARPEQLTLMLFDGAIRFSEKAKRCIEQTDFEGSFHALTRAEQIVMELLSGLRPESQPEVCRRQAGLYLFVYSKLVETNMSRAPAPLDDALRVLGILRETWLMLMEKLTPTDGPETPSGETVHAAGTVSLEG